MYFVYIIWSSRLQKYYIGHTDGLQRRLLEHNSSRSVFTKKGIPWELVYHEDFENRSEARKREYEIKSRKSKKYIEKLIADQSVHSIFFLPK